jgi:TatD DNase family protein
MFELFDAHCHAQDEAYGESSDDVIRESLAQGVKMIVVGTDYATSLQDVELAERHDGVWAAVGLHPNNLFGATPEIFDAERFRALIRHPKVVAVGEMGLDYHYHYDGVSEAELKSRERACFAAGVRLAREEGVPVIIHSRDAQADQLRLVEELWGPYQAGEPPRGVAHCFAGSLAEAERYIALGFYISFAGNLTYKPRKSDLAAGLENLPDLAQALPLDRILVETDAPYLTPVPHRGEQNFPYHVEQVARRLAEIRGLPFETIAAATTANVRRLFPRVG